MTTLNTAGLYLYCSKMCKKVDTKYQIGGCKSVVSIHMDTISFIIFNWHQNWITAIKLLANCGTK